jgi:hypothetical protein
MAAILAQRGDGWFRGRQQPWACLYVRADVVQPPRHRLSRGLDAGTQDRLVGAQEHMADGQTGRLQAGADLFEVVGDQHRLRAGQVLAGVERELCRGGGDQGGAASSLHAY